MEDDFRAGQDLRDADLSEYVTKDKAPAPDSNSRSTDSSGDDCGDEKAAPARVTCYTDSESGCEDEAAAPSVQGAYYNLVSCFLQGFVPSRLKSITFFLSWSVNMSFYSFCCDVQI